MRRYSHVLPSRASSPKQLTTKVVVENGANRTAGSAVFCSLLSPPWRCFQMEVCLGAAGAPLLLLDKSWHWNLSGVVAAAQMTVKLFCCRQGKQSYGGMQVLHMDGSDFCRFYKMPAEVGTEACSGKEGLAVYTRMPNSSQRKDLNVNSFMWNVKTNCELTQLPSPCGSTEQFVFLFRHPSVICNLDLLLSCTFTMTKLKSQNMQSAN